MRPVVWGDDAESEGLVPTQWVGDRPCWGHSRVHNEQLIFLSPGEPGPRDTIKFCNCHSHLANYETESMARFLDHTVSKQSLALAESPLRHLVSVSSFISHFSATVGIGIRSRGGSEGEGAFKL